MTTLFILNDPPYGTERVYNGLRLATNLQRLDEGHDVVVFLMGDAASSAKAGQSDGAQRSTLDELTQETLAADKVLVF